MSDDLSEFLDMDLLRYEYLWNCAICLHLVIRGVALMFQYLELFEDSVFLTSAWCRCYRCKHSYHVDCIASSINAKHRNSYLGSQVPLSAISRPPPLHTKPDQYENMFLHCLTLFPEQHGKNKTD